MNKGQPVERCGLFVEKVSESLYEGKCRCHKYLVKKGHIGRVSDSVDKPLEYCNKHVTFSPDDWGKFRNWFDDIYSWVEKANQKFTREIVR